jgi:hypothetical protein
LRRDAAVPVAPDRLFVPRLLHRSSMTMAASSPVAWRRTASLVARFLSLPSLLLSMLTLLVPPSVQAPRRMLTPSRVMRPFRLPQALGLP